MFPFQQRHFPAPADSELRSVRADVLRMAADKVQALCDTTILISHATRRYLEHQGAPMDLC